MSFNHEKPTVKSKKDLEVPCELMYPDDAETFVIITHGFGSSKESATAQMMLHDLPQAGFGAIAYDLPAHGTAEARGTDLTIENCITSLRAVEKYIAERFSFPEICYFSSSFGAYLTLLSFTKNRYSIQEHRGSRAFLRSAAVNMPDLFTKDPDPEVLRILGEQGAYTIMDAGPAPVRITQQFFDELKENDLFKAAAEIPFDDLDIQMVHGEKDMVIAPEAAKRFAEENGIPLVMFDGEDHTLSTHPVTPARVSELAIKCFKKK